MWEPGDAESQGREPHLPKNRSKDSKQKWRTRTGKGFTPAKTEHQAGVSTLFFYPKEEHDSLSPAFNAGIAIISQRKTLNKGTFFQNLDVIQNLEEKKNSEWLRNQAENIISKDAKKTSGTVGPILI